MDANSLTLQLSSERLARAQAKGVGVSAAQSSYNTALKNASARANDKIAAAKPPTKSAIPASDLASNMLAGRDTLHNPTGEGDGVNSILASGGVFTEFTYCSSGTPVTAWWPIWATDPTS